MPAARSSRTKSRCPSRVPNRAHATATIPLHGQREDLPRARFLARLSRARARFLVRQQVPRSTDLVRRAVRHVQGIGRAQDTAAAELGRVTNLDNGRKLRIRVNDRGPFKEGRIIDLSYAAAVKLDVLDAGTAAVEVRAIDFGGEAAAIAARPVSVPVELQAGAFSNRETADQLARRLSDAGIENVQVKRARIRRDTVWRVRIGPVWEAALAQRLVDRVLGLGLEAPVYVYP